jgi:hypothetical protein
LRKGEDMSEGPIKLWRDSWKPPVVSSRDSARVCFKKLNIEKAWCGRKPKVAYDDWARVTCSDCLAARRADEREGI